MTCGIYKIVNNVNGKLYIGSSKNTENRKTQHFSQLASKKHHSPKLQRSYNKHGKDAFDFELIEEYEESILTEREQYWMDTFKSYGQDGYNCSILAHRALNSYGNMVSEKVMQKNGKYLELFLDNMRLMAEYEAELPEVMVSFFGFKLNKTSKEVVFKRAWQCSSIILWVASDIRYLNHSKEYRLNGITFIGDGEYHISENTSIKSLLHDRVKTNDVVSLMKEDLIEKLGQSRYGKYILLKWRELETEEATDVN